MPTLSARLVLRPIHGRKCDDCGRIIGPHIYMYGMSDYGDKPGSVRFCIKCAITLRSKKVIELIEKFRCAVEQTSAELKAWQRIIETLGIVEDKDEVS